MMDASGSGRVFLQLWLLIAIPCGISMILHPAAWKQFYVETSWLGFVRKFWEGSSLRLFQMIGVVALGLAIYVAVQIFTAR